MARARSLVTSAQAGSLVLVFAIVTGATIALTRLYLDLTGYPSIGGATFHLAHALWGGLALMIAVVLLLAVRGRWVEPTGAVLGGVGAGLFVDEVGKFMTRANDYFFPLAAPVVYLCLIALAYAAYAAGRAQRTTARSHLHAALDLARDVADGRPTPSRVSALRDHAEAAEAVADDDTQRDLARALLAVASTEAAVADQGHQAWWTAAAAGVRRLEQRWLPLERFRRVLRVGLITLAVLTGVSSLIGLPLSIFAALSPDVGELTFERTTGTAGPVAFALYGVSSAVGLVVAVLWWLGARALRARHLDVPTAWRRVAIGTVLAMVVVNATSAYLDQFMSLAGLAVNALTVAAMASFTTRSGHPLE